LSAFEVASADNAFGWIADFAQAQKLADEFRVEMLHRKLDQFAAPLLSGGESSNSITTGVRTRSSSQPTSYSKRFPTDISPRRLMYPA
jgi:hypothetical protein